VETAGYALGMEPCSSPPIAVNASYFDIDVSCGVHFERTGYVRAGETAVILGVTVTAKPEHMEKQSGDAAAWRTKFQWPMPCN
jgi:hypothetical protein